jgi:prepilin-type processing-associated H-X9-DG protein
MKLHQAWTAANPARANVTFADGQSRARQGTSGNLYHAGHVLVHEICFETISDIGQS